MKMIGFTDWWMLLAAFGALTGCFNWVRLSGRLNRSFIPIITLVGLNLLLFASSFLPGGLNAAVWGFGVIGWLGLVWPLANGIHRRQFSAGLNAAFPPENIIFLGLMGATAWLLQDYYCSNNDFYSLYYRQFLYLQEYGRWHQADFGSVDGEYCCFLNAIYYFIAKISNNFSVSAFLTYAQMPIVCASFCLGSAIRWEKFRYTPAIFAYLIFLHLYGSNGVAPEGFAGIYAAVVWLIIGCVWLGNARQRYTRAELLAGTLPILGFLLMSRIMHWIMFKSDYSCDQQTVALLTALVIIFGSQVMRDSLIRVSNWNYWAVILLLFVLPLIKASSVTLVMTFLCLAAMAFFWQLCRRIFRRKKFVMVLLRMTMLMVLFGALPIAGYLGWSRYCDSAKIVRRTTSKISQAKIDNLLAMKFTKTDKDIYENTFQFIKHGFSSYRGLSAGILFYGPRARAYWVDLCGYTLLALVLALLAWEKRTRCMAFVLLLGMIFCNVLFFFLYCGFNQYLLNMGYHPRHLMIWFMATAGWSLFMAFRSVAKPRKVHWQSCSGWWALAASGIGFGMIFQYPASNDQQTYMSVAYFARNNADFILQEYNKGNYIFTCFADSGSTLMVPGKHFSPGFHTHETVDLGEHKPAYILTRGGAIELRRLRQKVKVEKNFKPDAMLSATRYTFARLTYNPDDELCGVEILLSGDDITTQKLGDSPLLPLSEAKIQ